jgi:hypothetical protein
VFAMLIRKKLITKKWKVASVVVHKDSADCTYGECPREIQKILRVPAKKK